MSGGELERAEALVAQGDFDAARALGEQMAGSAGGHNLLGFLAHREGRLIEAQRQFEHACALAPDDEDSRANLESVRAELSALYGAPAVAAPAEQEFGGSIDELHAGAYGPDLSSRLLGRLLASGLPDDVEARLFQVPGATTRDELRFLCGSPRGCGTARATCSRTARCSAARPARWRWACSPTRCARRTRGCRRSTGSMPVRTPTSAACRSTR